MQVQTVLVCLVLLGNVSWVGTSLEVGHFTAVQRLASVDALAYVLAFVQGQKLHLLKRNVSEKGTSRIFSYFRE